MCLYACLHACYVNTEARALLPTTFLLPGLVMESRKRRTPTIQKQEKKTKSKPKSTTANTTTVLNTSITNCPHCRAKLRPKVREKYENES
mmetsp:Transcript_11011/g.17762  ORF Transcript_11011/g.17762 Transcript_11011/m.17762 type:complete len:90 (-) Transcript_11011:184-453(-)